MSPVARRITIAIVLASAIGGGSFYLLGPKDVGEPTTAQASQMPEPTRDREAAELAWAKGIAAIEADDAERAIELLDQAIAADSSFAEAYVARGNARIATSEFDVAIADFDRALAIDLEQAEAISGKGMVYWLRGDLSNAEREFGSVTALRPNDRSAAVRYTIVLYDQGKKREIRNFYEDAYRKNPNTAWVVGGLLDAIRSAQPDEASRHQASRARAMSMWYDGVRLTEVASVIGLADYNSGDYNAAISKLEPLLDEDPNGVDPQVIAHLAWAYSKIGMSEKCFATWNDYLIRMGRAMPMDHAGGQHSETTGFPDANTACNPQLAQPGA